jgi:ABC-type amino acid transport substrate-binding protein
MGYSKRAMSFVAVNALAGRVVFALFVSSVTALVASRAVDTSLSNRTGELRFSDGESVAVLRGSAADDWLFAERERGAAAVTPRRFDSMQEMIQSMEQGDLDQALIDQRAASDLLQRGDLRILAEHPLRFYQAFAVSDRVSPALLAQINIAITQIRAVEHYEH